MKIKKFYKKLHPPFTILYSIFYFIIVAIVVTCAVREQFFSYRFFQLLCFLLIGFFWMILLDLQGVYIIDDTVYYKKALVKQKIDASSIVAIIIVHTYDRPYNTWVQAPIKDFQGNYFYSMFALSSLNKTMINYNKGNIRFQEEYKKDILFQTVYDEELIEYLKRYVPSITIHKTDAKPIIY